jgi:acyl-CoA reductase-like NAD-dependent aldehyde dehydrogenase
MQILKIASFNIKEEYNFDKSNKINSNLSTVSFIYNYIFEIIILNNENMDRLEVLKTYKIYIGGLFPRTESGRYYQLLNPNGKNLANICLSSGKDFKNAVVQARLAFEKWSARTAFNRSQILYRIAEMLESRKLQFIGELISQGSTQIQAELEVNTSIDRMIYYAGWCDKTTQVFSTVNPVSTPHFNFSNPEPTGVVAIIAPETHSLLGIVSVIAPVIAGGNCCIVLASESKPLCAITFAEVLNSSDVPGGVVNILTGSSQELSMNFATHMDVNAIIYTKTDSTELKSIQEKAVDNFKRVFDWGAYNWENDNEVENPYMILDTLEIKTTWHPIEKIGSGKSGY